MTVLLATTILVITLQLLGAQVGYIFLTALPKDMDQTNQHLEMLMMKRTTLII